MPDLSQWRRANAQKRGGQPGLRRLSRWRSHRHGQRVRPRAAAIPRVLDDVGQPSSLVRPAEPRIARVRAVYQSRRLAGGAPIVRHRRLPYRGRTRQPQELDGAQRHGARLGPVQQRLGAQQNLSLGRSVQRRRAGQPRIQHAPTNGGRLLPARRASLDRPAAPLRNDPARQRLPRAGNRQQRHERSRARHRLPPGRRIPERGEDEAQRPDDGFPGDVRQPRRLPQQRLHVVPRAVRQRSRSAALGLHRILRQSRLLGHRRPDDPQGRAGAPHSPLAHAGHSVESVHDVPLPPGERRAGQLLRVHVVGLRNRRRARLSPLRPAPAQWLYRVERQRLDVRPGSHGEPSDQGQRVRRLPQRGLVNAGGVPAQQEGPTARRARRSDSFRRPRLARSSRAHVRHPPAKGHALRRLPLQTGLARRRQAVRRHDRRHRDQLQRLPRHRARLRQPCHLEPPRRQRPDARFDPLRPAALRATRRSRVPAIERHAGIGMGGRAGQRHHHARAPVLQRKRPLRQDHRNRRQDVGSRRGGGRGVPPGPPRFENHLLLVPLGVEQQLRRLPSRRHHQPRCRRAALRRRIQQSVRGLQSTGAPQRRVLPGHQRRSEGKPRFAGAQCQRRSGLGSGGQSANGRPPAADHRRRRTRRPRVQPQPAPHGRSGHQHAQVLRLPHFG